MVQIGSVAPASIAVMGAVEKYMGKRRNFTGHRFRVEGYCAVTIRPDEATIRQYIRNLEADEKRLEQLTPRGLWPSSSNRSYSRAFIIPPAIGAVAYLEQLRENAGESFHG